MRILIRLLVLCYAMFFCGTATATAELTAGQLRDFCISKREWRELVCVEYIDGFRDGYHIGMYGAARIILGPDVVVKKQNTDKDYQRFSVFCVPSAVTNGQVQEVFVKYMNEHPEKLHLLASTQLIYALEQYFPCKRETKGDAK